MNNIKSTFLIRPSQMVKVVIFVLLTITISSQAQQRATIEPYTALEFNVGTTLGQMRMAPVEIKGDRHMLLIYSEMRNIDPFEGSFHLPTSTIKLALYDFKGNQKWKKELPHVMPGIWFLPVLAFDLDGDATDEIFFVNNLDEEKPFNYSGYRLQRLNAVNGELTGDWPWPSPTHNQSNSYKWRFFIVGGYVNNKPVLLTSQGTYRDMKLQAWNQDMSPRWKKDFPDVYAGPLDKEKISDHYRAINKDVFDGPRGSHSTPIIDTNHDGIDEVLIGERCIEFDKGDELFIMDHKKWDNHSDIVQPVWNNKDNKWYFWTCREKGDDERRRPRAVFFNEKGDPLWSIKETRGHFHRGWIANIGPNGEKLAFAGRYGIDKENSVIIGGRPWELWTFDAFSGKEVAVPFTPLGSPFDFNGDGIHEIIVENEIFDNAGKKCGSIGKDASVITLYKINNDYQGEQILAYYPDGIVKLWVDKNAKEGKERQKSFSSNHYQRNIKHTGVGYNRMVILNY